MENQLMSSSSRDALRLINEPVVDSVQRQFEAVGDAELVEDVVQMVFDGLLGDEKFFADFLVAEALGDSGATLEPAPARDDCQVKEGGREAAELHCPDDRSPPDTGSYYCGLKAAPPSSGGSADAFGRTGTAESSATTEAAPSDACNGAIHAEQQR